MGTVSTASTPTDATRTPRTAVLPGSYDPFTLGHLDIVLRASRLFDRTVVAVLHNPAKTGLIDADERVELIRESLPADAGSVEVASWADTLLVDVCHELGADAVVKGLRGSVDLGYERPMALMNRHLEGVETLYLDAAPEWEHVSSSLVKQVAAGGRDVSGLVPRPVADALIRRFGAAPGLG